MTHAVLLRGGYYDIYRLDQLRAELQAVQPHSDVLLDLATTESLDCACLGALVGHLNVWRQRAPDTNLRLKNIHPRVARILTLTQLDKVFIVENVLPPSMR